MIKVPSTTAKTMPFFNSFRAGDPVIVCLTKRGVRPSRRAKDVRPETCGEGYIYRVDKFWTVSEVLPDRLVLRTPKGRVRVLGVTAPNLHRACWWERLVYRHRFARLAASGSSDRFQNASSYSSMG